MQAHRHRVRFSQEATRALLAHSWPGNIRELENKVQRAVIMAQGKLIEPADLVLEHAKPASESPSLREARTRAEHQSVLEALVKHRGNISRAAKEPG